jgi:hypothetical protein
MKRTREALAATAICVLASCASARVPVSEIAAAEVAVRDAERADAGTYASLDLQQARYKLQDAKRAADDRDNVRARRLAEESLVDARVAETKAQLGKANAAISEQRMRSTTRGRTAAEGF